MVDFAIKTPRFTGVLAMFIQGAAKWWQFLLRLSTTMSIFQDNNDPEQAEQREGA
jgi:hypothetical protein